MSCKFNLSQVVLLSGGSQNFQPHILTENFFFEYLCTPGEHNTEYHHTDIVCQVNESIIG